MISVENSVVIGHLKAENDLSAKQFHIVELSAAEQVDVADGATDLPIGILLNKPIAGEYAEVQIGGVAKVVCDAAITAGALVGTSADGQAVTKSTDADRVIGIALSTTANAGELVSVLLRFFQRAS